jgi:uncharacterized membrane protein
MPEQSPARPRRQAVRRSSRRIDLAKPRARGGFRLGIHYDPDQFGRFSETIARFLGTARFLVMQTAVVIVWISLNVFAVRLRWDPYPFILLNLAFSTQAAYAAPLILLAQNRQEERDRRQTERDRQIAARTQADTEFLARELASIRLALNDVATVDEIEKALERVSEDAEKRAESLRVELLRASGSADGGAGLTAHEGGRAR